MILFCDTSALVKLYLRETGSAEMAASAAHASAMAVSRIAWVEAVAAMARRARDDPQAAVVLETARRRLRLHWAEYLIVEFTQALVERAGEFADTFALRAYDSVQLAAARTIQEATEEIVGFACFDGRLRKAAKVLGMRLVPPEEASQDPDGPRPSGTEVAVHGVSFEKPDR